MASSAEILPGRVAQRAEHLVPPGQPEPGAQPHGPGLQLGDLIQAGLMQLLRRAGQGGEDPDGPGVVLLPARQPDQPGPVGRPGPRQQLPDRLHPPGQRRPHHLVGHRPALLLPRRRARPARRGLRGEHRLQARQHVLRPGDGPLGQRGDRQPPLGRPGPQPLAELAEPGAAAPQPGQVGLCRLRVDQDRPRGHRQEGGRPGELHGGDGVLGRRHVDAVLLVRARLPDAAERDGLGRRGRRDRAGLLTEPPDLGAPGLLARLALVRQQVVVPGYAVHGGGEGVVFQPALLEAVGQVPG